MRVVDGDVVLNEQRHGALVDEAPPLAERDVERVGRSGQERVDAREIEHAGALGEVLVDEVPGTRRRASSSAGRSRG